MQIIPIAPAPTALPASAAEALSGLVACIGQPGFGPEGLALLNPWLPAAWWAIYRLLDDAPPRLHALGCTGGPDRTRESWQVYREGLYRADESFQAARALLPGHRGVLLHRHAREIPPRHRSAIYSRNGLHERLSLVAEEPGQGLLAINLFRHESQPGFSSAEIDTLRLAGPLLLACVQRHAAWHEAQDEAQDVPQPPDPFTAITPRERAVCERLLRGLTHEGIAADLGLSPATVKTYRDRAFERLGIHHRNELFALALGALSPPAATGSERPSR